MPFLPMRVRAVASLLAEPPWPILLLVTLCGWIAVAFHGHAQLLRGLCVSGGTWAERGWRELSATLSLLTPLEAGLSWLLMLVAMMTPVLAGPIRHVRLRSLRSRRRRALALFLAAYGAVWMLAGPVLAAMVIALSLLDREVGLPAGTACVLLLVVWQVSPWKQVALNRCHLTPGLAPFGGRADLDCLKYGLVNASWCVATCWALMLVSMAVPVAHLAVMAALGAIMVHERIQPPRLPAWRLPLDMTFARTP